MIREDKIFEDVKYIKFSKKEKVYIIEIKQKIIEAFKKFNRKYQLGF